MEKILKEKFKFIDLFAGIGGFHQAMMKLGGECVFAAEFSEETAKTYHNNYNINAFFDVTKVNPHDIPEHDVLCAGFPCQAFSKAGNRKGFGDVRGVLFFDIIRILRYHITGYGGPKFLVLENVRNLVSHDDGNTWKRIRKELVGIGYNVVKDPIIVSPHYFGIPQLRERVVIVAVRNDIYNKEINILIEKKTRNTTSMDTVIVQKSSREYKINEFRISDYEEKVLDMWDEFIKGMKNKTLGFPIWTQEFFSNKDTSKLPLWKQDFINKNKKLYEENKEFIDKWYEKHHQLHWVKKTHKKFEWQASTKIESVYQGIIQFRPSGVRVKQPTEFPTLVAMVHIPIIGKYKRYLTPREVANLQSFSSEFKIDANVKLAYKQFGNAVNVDVVYNVFRLFLEKLECELNE